VGFAVGVDVADCKLESLAADDVKKLEADCFWCFSKLLDGIQDNYTFAQPGIQRRVGSLKDLVSRIDSESIANSASLPLFCAKLRLVGRGLPMLPNSFVCMYLTKFVVSQQFEVSLASEQMFG